MVFIKQVEEQLIKMSEAEKVEWIISQARLLPERNQQDFLMSLSGEKKIIYMPSQREIEEFCEKVERGEIYLEYETHYYEFDDNGRYMDNWKVWHNDPSGAMPFLNRVFKGCQDLLILSENKSVADIMDRVCGLEFKVVEAEDSEGFDDAYAFTVVDAANERMISVDIRDVGVDWITSVVRLTDQWESLELANILVRIFKHPVCKKINPSMLIGEAIPEGLFLHMLNVLNLEITSDEIMFNKLFSEIRYSREKHLFEKKLKRKQEILLDIRLKCLNPVEKKSQQKVSTLSSSWEQIQELLEQLKFERYIDDQWEIEEIWKICNALIRRGKFEQEEWELRKKILSDVIIHGYYDIYGCYDPMMDLSKEICIEPEEFLALAKIMEESGYYEKEAAELYHQYGRDDKYASYLETHLGKESETYAALIKYYKEHNNFDGARQVAEQGLEKCKDDLTDIFIYLLMDAKKNGDEVRYKKFYSSAKRRRGADMIQIDEALK